MYALKHLLGDPSAWQAPCGARHFPADTPQALYWAYISAYVWGGMCFRKRGELSITVLLSLIDNVGIAAGAPT